MGMFDYIRCEAKLPVEDVRPGAFQTKDTPAQWLDEYIITAEGQLLHEEYDIEDRSDPNATGLAAFAGIMTRVNKRRVPSDFTGEICFYGLHDEHKGIGWIEFSAYFVGGQLKELHCIANDTGT